MCQNCSNNKSSEEIQLLIKELKSLREVVNDLGREMYRMNRDAYEYRRYYSYDPRAHPPYFPHSMSRPF